MGESRVEFGKYLAAARLKAGRSLEDVAGLSRVATHHLEALEQGRGDSLPVGMHRRAMLRSYAAATGLEPHATVERFERIFGPALPPLVDAGSSPEKIESALWHRGISRVATFLRRAVGPVAGTLRQTVTFPIRVTRRTAGMVGRAFSRTFALFAYIVPAAIAFLSGLARRSVRVVPRRRFRVGFSSSVISIPAAIALTAIVTTHIVTTRSQKSDVGRQEFTTARASSGNTQGTEVLVGTGGHALSPDRKPVDDTAKASEVRRAVERKAPAVAKIAKATPRAARSANVVSTRGSRLVVTSIPRGARVTVNGIAWGVTPVTIRHLPPGDKVIRVTKDGYFGAERRLSLRDQEGTRSVGLTLRARRNPSSQKSEVRNEK
jgi:hypothetical protein